MKSRDGRSREEVSDEVMDAQPYPLEIPHQGPSLSHARPQIAWGSIRILKIPFKLIIQLHRSEDDVELRLQG
jgi:hypothetical protein